MASSLSVSKDLRRLLAFGSGVGIEIGPKDLEIAAARVRPSGIHVLGRLTIEDFASRPAAEWGLDYTRFLKSVSLSHVSASVLLPRRELITRQIALPGVASRDVENAIRFQLDSLHPYGDDEVCWGWSPLSGNGSALVGIARRSAVDRYVQLFNEAGIAVSSFTSSAAAVHAAIRLNGHAANAGFIALSPTTPGSVEVYGESESRPVFSAEFEMPPQRAAQLALSELRLPPDTVPLALDAVLPKPISNPVENDLARNAMPYATALSGACPMLSSAANILPKEFRRLSSRRLFIPSIVLATVAVLLAAGTWIYSSYADRKYLAELHQLIARVQPQAMRSAQLDRDFLHTQSRVQLLDRYRNQTHTDLDALNDLTRLIAPPAWAGNIELTRDALHVYGEAPQAAALPKILDSSPYFQNSGIDGAGPIAGGVGESFQIHSARSKR